MTTTARDPPDPGAGTCGRSMAVDRWRSARTHQLFLEYFRAYNEVHDECRADAADRPDDVADEPVLPGQRHHADHEPGPDTRPHHISRGLADGAAGPRQQQLENTTERVLGGGLEGTGAGWTYNATATTRVPVVKQIFTDGYVNRTKIRDGLQGTQRCAVPESVRRQSAAGTELHRPRARSSGEVQGSTATSVGHQRQRPADEIFNLPAPVPGSAGGRRRIPQGRSQLTPTTSR